MKRTFAAATLVAGLIAGSAQAEVIALYDFDSAAPSLSSADTSTVTATDLVVGAGLTTHVIQTDGGGSVGDDAGRSRAPDWGGIGDNVAFDNDSYTFTVTPSGTDTLNFTSFTLDAVNDEVQSDPTIFVYSSLVDGTLDSAADLIGSITLAQSSELRVSDAND